MPRNAAAYEVLLKETVIPGLQELAGYRGGHILRRDAGDEVEFVVLNFFDSVEAVKKFAGENYTVPVFEPAARALLSRVEEFATHYEVRSALVTI